MDNKIISYLTLRKVIGILGMALGFICIFGGLIATGKVETSISAYYNTVMRDILESILVTAGAFLITYKGYDLKDNIVSWVSGVAAVGIAMFPIGTSLHFPSSALFFVSLAYMSLFQFTQGKNKKRNIVYRVCGLTIIGSLILFPLLSKVAYSVIVLEIIMLEAFGISWLTKGSKLWEQQL